MIGLRPPLPSSSRRAGWHRPGAEDLPNDVCLVKLPPYSPDLLPRALPAAARP